MGITYLRCRNALKDVYVRMYKNVQWAYDKEVSHVVCMNLRASYLIQILQQWLTLTRLTHHLESLTVRAGKL